MKTSILDEVEAISTLDTIDDKITIEKFMKVLKNDIILHGRVLEGNPGLVKIIENSLQKLEMSYDRISLHGMLNNIKSKRTSNNINFRNITDRVSYDPPMSERDRCVIEKKLSYFRKVKQVAKNHVPFEVGSIVGAKDKENNWWLSRVLYVYTTPNISNYWYYIRFEGWGEDHDEWINSDRHRVQFFKPKKHHLKR